HAPARGTIQERPRTEPPALISKAEFRVGPAPGTLQEYAHEAHLHAQREHAAEHRQRDHHSVPDAVQHRRVQGPGECEQTEHQGEPDDGRHPEEPIETKRKPDLHAARLNAPSVYSNRGRPYPLRAWTLSPTRTAA